MAPKRPKTHLTAERIQAFLDDALSRDERAEVQEHATFCGRCHAELETWQHLYSELGELPEFSPAPNFQDRVLAGLDTAVPAAQAEKRRFGWLRRRAVRVAEHLDPERLQDYVEGLLPAPQMARVSAHLEACGGCRGEEEQWRSLIQGIEKLPVMAPSRAFASHVMGPDPDRPTGAPGGSQDHSATCAGLGGPLDPADAEGLGRHLGHSPHARYGGRSARVRRVLESARDTRGSGVLLLVENQRWGHRTVGPLGGRTGRERNRLLRLFVL